MRSGYLSRIRVASAFLRSSGCSSLKRPAAQKERTRGSPTRVVAREEMFCQRRDRANATRAVEATSGGADRRSGQRGWDGARAPEAPVPTAISLATPVG